MLAIVIMVVVRYPITVYEVQLIICNVLLSIADKPGPPEAPTVSDITKTGCVVTWQPPKEDGGSPVTGYHVERCLAKSDRWLKISKGSVAELKFTVNDLVEGNEYQFRVSAENKVGVGLPSSPSPPFAAKDPFSKRLFFAFLEISLSTFMHCTCVSRAFKFYKQFHSYFMSNFLHL